VKKSNNPVFLYSDEKKMLIPYHFNKDKVQNTRSNFSEFMVNFNQNREKYALI
jgi:hypothetical protein